jgi:NADP-dependent 3-hydroxy acid dehydrogenase YdfG
MSTWLITGTCARYRPRRRRQALAAGHQVVATARDSHTIQDLEDAHLGTSAAIRLALTDPASFTAALEAAESRFGGVP